MALTDAQWSAAQIDINARLNAGTITEAQAIAELTAATENWPTRTLSNADLAARVSRFLARLNGLILTEGPPDAALGELNTFAYDTVNGALYGPKTLAGWGVPVSLVGPEGAKGDTGDVGPKGDQGDIGPKGDKGERGEQGQQGDQGEQGVQGERGLKGDKGDQGEKGDRGDAFAVNAQGTLAGRDAYDAQPVGFSYLDVDNGNLYFRVAPSGWSTPIPFGKGEKGDKGDKGDPGDEGPQGPAGADGAPGSDAQVVFATVAEVRAGAVDGKVISPKVAADALATVVITRADAAIGINFDSLINATITLDANGTLGQPSGGYPGKSGVLTVINASGTASLAAHSSYRMPKGGITIEGGVNAASRIPYMVGDGAVILFPASKWSA